ncbi:MAG: GFA family protein [Proteobacteria bacterium]|nr:GFA family protein [Pseudomonadota bacterium]
MTLTLPLDGGCICGALRYRVKDLPLAVFMCHCDNCQKRTGSAFSLSMIVWRKDFETTSGETLWCDLPGGSGALHRQHVCPHCLTRTHTEMMAHPDIINVRPGTLDRPQAVMPVAQVWTSAAHPWALAADIRCFEENPIDVPSLVAEWRARHG